ncbi:glycosyltransferase [Candidatus Bathyarchaeota archaeon]|nr:glycosyltransferase [Candidatus Bathyarchaeota archaeon]
MRIGVFHPALDMYGGAELVAVATANALAQNGYDTVLFVNKWVDYKKIEEMMGAPLSSSVKVMVHPAFLQPRGMFHLYESAFRSLAFKASCDILIDTYSSYIFPWIDVSYMHFPYLNNYEFRSKFPYLKSAHLSQVLTVPYAAFEKNLENYDEKLILANSYFTAKAIKESLGAESKVLYPPVPSALSEKNIASFESPRENLVVTIARFGPDKNVDLIPQIAHQTDKNVRFLMIGLAHDLAVVQAVKRRIKELKLEDRVTLMINASRQDIKKSLSKAKVYLHTKKMEHFGISIAEAMSMGCLPVVHNSGGAPEFVPNRYRYNDLREAAEIVEKAIYQWDPDKARSVVKIAERFSETNFSIRFIDLFIDYCDSLKK